MKQFKVLVIPGGGMKGCIPLVYLKQIELNTGKKIHELFDLIIGTSTGSIIACALGAEIKTIEEIQTLYRQEGRNIFKKNIMSLFTSKYVLMGLVETLSKYFKSTLMKDSKTKVIAVARDVLNNENMIMKSYGHYENLTMRDATIASSAAPRYFPPYPFTYINKKITYDGGLYAANPALIAQAEANKLGYSDDEILLVTLGTGFTKRKEESISNPSLLKLVDIVISQMLRSQDELVHYVNQLSIKNYHYFDVEIPSDLSSMDEYKNVPKWEELTNKQLTIDNERLNTVCQLIQQK